jgi:hypothetical protein
MKTIKLETRSSSSRYRFRYGGKVKHWPSLTPDDPRLAGATYFPPLPKKNSAHPGGMQKKISVSRNGLKVKSSKPAHHLITLRSIRSRGYGGDLYLRPSIQLANPPCRFRATQLRQTQIHPDKVRPPLLQRLDPECPILCASLSARQVSSSTPSSARISYGPSFVPGPSGIEGSTQTI